VSPRPVQYLVWFGGSAGITALLTPVARRIAHRFGLVDRPGGQSYKWHQTPTAYLGGLVIALAILIVEAFGRTRGLSPMDQATVILSGGVVCALVGAWDDWRSLGVAAKLLPTVAGGAAVWAAGVRVGLSGNGTVDLFLTVTWIVVVTHAVNVIDNMDGVAVGLAAISATGVFSIAVASGQTRVALMAAAVAGASVAFLPFNFRRATVYLGDAGTLFLGFMLASLALTLDVPGGTAVARVSVPLLLMGIPVFNTALVVVSRVRAGRRITVGGTDGIAHRLVALGLSRSDAAVAFWGAGVVSAGVAVLLTHASVRAAASLCCTVVVAGGVGLWLFGRIDTAASPEGRGAQLTPAPWPRGQRVLAGNPSRLERAP
jgi:UDP-GlcNAc:undecaprenyl-phosphate/decaprenyl-phosphate GlcNAc-1-phosphate transferase